VTTRPSSWPIATRAATSCTTSATRGRNLGDQRGDPSRWILENYSLRSVMIYDTHIGVYAASFSLVDACSFFVASCPDSYEDLFFYSFTANRDSFYATEGVLDTVFFGSGGGAGAGVLKKLWASAVETVIRRTGSKWSSRTTRSRNWMRKLLVMFVIRWSTLMISCCRTIRHQFSVLARSFVLNSRSVASWP
jgi:hypothetical protein